MSPRPDERRRRRGRERLTFPDAILGDPGARTSRTLLIVTLLTAAALFAAIKYLGMRQFGAEDGGITAAIAYMVKLGYVPIRDFETTGFPPLYMLAGGWAFRMLGTRWESLVTLAALTSSMALVVQTWLGRRAGFSPVTAIAIAIVTQCATFLPLSNWWYNQLTSVVGVLFVTAALAFARQPEDRLNSASLLLTAAVISWCKPNVAALLLLGVGIVIVSSHRLRRRGLALMVGAAVLSLAGLVIVGLSPSGLISEYLGVGVRLTPGNFVTFFLLNDNLDVMLTMGLLVPALAAGVTSLVFAVLKPTDAQAAGPRVALAALAVATGLAAMGTNNDHNLVDAPLILLGCVAVACVAFGERGERRKTRLAVALALSFTLLGLSVYGTVSAGFRYRIYSVGPGAFWEKTGLSSLGGRPMLAGVSAGPALHTTLADIRATLRANPDVVASDGVFFGPRLLVMYPEFGVAPPKGLPTWWMLYRDGRPRTAKAVGRFAEEKRPLLIIFGGDYTDFPQSLRELIRSRYTAYHYGTLTLHVLKGSDVRVPKGAQPFKWDGGS